MIKSIKLKVTCIFLIYVIICKISFAQETFLKGYIIKNNGDTAFGYIDYRNWKYNPKDILFKSTLEKEWVTFTPNTIRSFMANDEIYESAKVNVEISSTETSKLDVGSNLNIKVDTIFLQTIFRGRKNLYYYNNINDRESFYIKQDGVFDLLIFKKYLTSDNYLVENKKYMNQLSLYLNDCPKIISKIENTSYSINSMHQLFTYYFKQTKSAPTVYKQKEKIKLELGVLAGVSSTLLKFGKEGGQTAFVTFGNTDYKPSYNFCGGFFIDGILPRTQNKWSVNNEIFYTSFGTSGVYSENNTNTSTIKTTTNFGASYLKINSMFRYRHKVGGSSCVFINAGMSNGLSFNETNFINRTLYTSTINYTINEGAAMEDEDVRKYEQGLLLGLGLKHNKFSIEMRTERGTGMSSVQLFPSKLNRYYFLLGYKF